MSLEFGEAVLGGLILATALHRKTLLGDGDEIEQQLIHHAAGLPTALEAVIRHTEAAVASVINTGV